MATKLFLTLGVLHFVPIETEPRSKAAPDIFYRKAKFAGFRARSAFKLLEIHRDFNIFENVSSVVDLCAAPGSWSQVIVSEVGALCSKPQVVAVDIRTMRPLPGVVQLTADITIPHTTQAIRSALGGDGKCELVVCDGAPDLTGLHELDSHLAHTLAISALRCASELLCPQGSFVLKVFVVSRSSSAEGSVLTASANSAESAFLGSHGMLNAQLRTLFDRVVLCKPSSSRTTSREHFVVCRGFRSTIFSLSTKCNLRNFGELPAQHDEVVIAFSLI